jgi:hypothetical protein
MIVSRVVPPALLDLHSPPQLADTVEPRVVVQKTSSCSCCATRSPSSAGPTSSPPGLGRSSCARRADATPTPRATRPPGHPGHRPALASPPGGQEVDLSEPLRSPARRRHDRRAGRTDGPREPDLGLSAHPRRTAQARPPRRRLYDPPDPQPAGPDRPRTTQQARNLSVFRDPEATQPGSPRSIVDPWA